MVGLYSGNRRVVVWFVAYFYFDLYCYRYRTGRVMSDECIRARRQDCFGGEGGVRAEVNKGVEGEVKG